MVHSIVSIPSKMFMNINVLQFPSYRVGETVTKFVTRTTD